MFKLIHQKLKNFRLQDFFYVPLEGSSTMNTSIQKVWKGSIPSYGLNESI